MAGHKYSATLTGAVTVASGTKTLMQLVAPSTRDCWLRAISISGKSVNGADVPVQFEVLRQTTAGTSGSTVTPSPEDPDTPAALSTVNISFSAEPTAGVLVLPGIYVTPVGGLFVYQESLGEEIKIKASTRLGFRITVAQSTDILMGLRYME